MFSRLLHNMIRTHQYGLRRTLVVKMIEDGQKWLIHIHPRSYLQMKAKKVRQDRDKGSLFHPEDLFDIFSSIYFYL